MFHLGDSLRFSTLIKYFEKLENMSSTQTMIQTLALMLKETTANNIDVVCYLTLGEIAAGYENVQLGAGSEITKSAVSIAFGIEAAEIEDQLKKIGDLGTVASKIDKAATIKIEGSAFKGKLSVSKLHKELMKIAQAEGSGSQEVKEKTLAAILAQANPEERKYVIRLVLGEMRLGVADKTLLDALAVAFLSSKKKRAVLEDAYNMCSDIGYVARILAKNGLKGVKRIRISLGRPIQPMLAQRVSNMSEIMEHMESEEIAAEEKYDGERIQAHKNRDEVKLFSRRLTDVTNQFPVVADEVSRRISAEKAVLDGEVVAYNFEEETYEPFQKLMQRRRKYNVKEFAEKIPVKYMLFDVLYVDGKSCMKKSYPQRRSKLEKIVKNSKRIAIANRIVSGQLEEIDGFFQDCLERGLEGIVCKSNEADSCYQAGARGWLWIKWKPSYATELSDTLDLVVIGAFAGKGKRAGTYGALLCAAYNSEEDVFQTVCKLGSGFSDKQLSSLPKKLENAKVIKKPARVSVNKEMFPDFWFSPKYVVEVLVSEVTQSPAHTCDWNAKKKRGLSLRFPRFKRWRSEKSSEQATTTSEVKDIFKRIKRSRG
jgi:DNA ligase-1